MRFRGGPVLTLDSKGRLTVPARWRDQLLEAVKGQLVLTKDPAGCLGLYPPPAWDQLEAVLVKLDANQDHWRRLYLGHAHDLEIDSASRVLIPPELRRWAGIKEGEPVVFMGVGAYFELWNAARHDVQEAQGIARGKPPELAGLVIQ
jgi:MraZ protein